MVDNFHDGSFAGIKVWERSWTPTLPPFLTSQSCLLPPALPLSQVLETCSPTDCAFSLLIVHFPSCVSIIWSERTCELVEVCLLQQGMFPSVSDILRHPQPLLWQNLKVIKKACYNRFCTSCKCWKSCQFKCQIFEPILNDWHRGEECNIECGFCWNKFYHPRPDQGHFRAVYKLVILYETQRLFCSTKLLQFCKSLETLMRRTFKAFQK